MQLNILNFLMYCDEYLSFDKSVKLIKWGCDVFFKRCCWDNQLLICIRMNWNFNFRIYIEFKCSWVLDIKVKDNIVNIMRLNIKFWLGNNFLVQINQILL